MNFDQWAWVTEFTMALVEAILEDVFVVASLTGCEMTALEDEVGCGLVADFTLHAIACHLAVFESLLECFLGFVGIVLSGENQKLGFPLGCLQFGEGNVLFS